MKPRGFEFEQIETIEPNMSWFDMSYQNKFTGNFGKLIPFYLEETMPKDRFKIHANIFARAQALLAPTMQHCDIFSYLFYVPNRILWDNWKKFQSNGDGTVKMVDAESYVPPEHPFLYAPKLFESALSAFDCEYCEYVHSGEYYICIYDINKHRECTLDECLHMFEKLDYLGLPFNYKILFDSEDKPHYAIAKTTVSDGVYTITERYSLASAPIGATLHVGNLLDPTWLVYLDYGTFTDLDKINAFPFFAYNKIYNEYFRSQDYEDESLSQLVDGDNSDMNVSYLSDVSLLKSKCFEHDYFTSLLPDAQRGRDVTLALAGTASLKNDTSNYSAHPTQVRGAGTSDALYVRKQSGNNNVEVNKSDGTSYGAVQLDITGHTTVDLTGVSAITINALRYANTLQKYEEQLARSGSRYNEMLVALYGVVSSDASIQRPIYLGASRIPLTINDVAQTSSSTEDSPLATLAGRAVAVGDTYTDFFCEENGWIIGLLAVVPRTQYFQGLSRHLRKFVALDYPIPLFAHLGEEEIKKEELYASGAASDDAALGYLPRFSSFKYHSDEIHTELRGSLKYWTMSRTLEVTDYSVGAVVDSAFMKADTMSYDAFADQDSNDHHFVFQVNNDVQLLRSLPEYSTPRL